jgi:hypothetical protein
MSWKHKADKAAYAIRYRQQRPEIVLWFSAKHRAKTMGLEFDLSVEDIVIPEFCPVLGIKLERSKTRGPQPNSPSVDRRDPAKGYTKNNISVISMKANTCKSDLTKDQLRSLWEYSE